MESFWAATRLDFSTCLWFLAQTNALKELKTPRGCRFYRHLEKAGHVESCNPIQIAQMFKANSCISLSHCCNHVTQSLSHPLLIQTAKTGPQVPLSSQSPTNTCLNAFLTQSHHVSCSTQTVQISKNGTNSYFRCNLHTPNTKLQELWSMGNKTRSGERLQDFDKYLTFCPITV